MNATEAWDAYAKSYDEGRGHAQAELEPARQAFLAGFAAGSGQGASSTAQSFAQGMFDVARANFRTAAAALVLGDPELQQQADALEKAVGDVSVDEALEGLRQFKEERRRKSR
jgi:hypothetical protein